MAQTQHEMDYTQPIEMVEVVSETEVDIEELLGNQNENFIDINIHDCLELSNEDVREENQIGVLYGSKVRSCCRLQCNKKIPKDLALEHRRNFQEMSKDQQDLMILTQLQSHRTNHLLYSAYDSKIKAPGDSDDIREETYYYFSGFGICKKMYLFLHNIGVKRFCNLVKHYDEHGISGRQHGNERKTPNRDNIFSIEDIENVVQFLKSYTEQAGRQICRPNGKKKSSRKVKLPPADTKAAIYRLYCQLNLTRKKASKSLFYKIWAKYTPYIIAGKKSSLGDS